MLVFSSALSFFHCVPCYVLSFSLLLCYLSVELLLLSWSTDILSQCWFSSMETVFQTRQTRSSIGCSSINVSFSKDCNSYCWRILRSAAQWKTLKKRKIEDGMETGHSSQNQSKVFQKINHSQKVSRKGQRSIPNPMEMTMQQFEELKRRWSWYSRF